MKSSKLKNFKDSFKKAKTDKSLEKKFSQMADEFEVEGFPMGMYMAAKFVDVANGQKGISVTSHTEKLTDGTQMFLARVFFMMTTDRLLKTSDRVKSRKYMDAILEARAQFVTICETLEKSLTEVVIDKKSGKK